MLPESEGAVSIFAAHGGLRFAREHRRAWVE